MSSAGSSSLVHSLLRSGGLVFVGLVFEVVVLFLTKVLMARVLGPDQFGAVSLGIAVLTVTSTLVLLGLDTGISRFMPRDDDVSATRGVVLSAMQIALPLALLSGGLLVVFAPAIGTHAFHDPSTVPILRVIALVVPLSVFTKLALGGIRGAKRILPKVYLKNVATPATRLVAVGGLLYIGWNAVGIAWAYFLSYAIACLIGLYYLRRDTPLFSKVSYTRRHRDLLVFSMPLVISAVMALVFDKLDTLMLGYFGATSQVGIYNVVYPVAWALLMMLNAFTYLFMPALSELHSEAAYDEMERMYQMTTKWIFLSTLPPFLVLVLFPRQIIAFAFGSAYAEGALALVVLSLAFFTHAVVGPNKESLTSIGRTRLIMYDNALVAGLNVVLNLLLIPRYSYLGAAVATAVSYALLNVLYSVQLHRAAGIQPLRPAQAWPGVITTALVLALYWPVTLRFGHGPVTMVVVVGAILVVYPLAIYYFGRFEPEEISALQRLRGRFDGVARVLHLIGF